MGLSRSLSISASSMQAHQQRFDVISNNIANASTIGYKSNRANFSEQFNQIMNYGKSPDSAAGIGIGGINPQQMGLGVKVASITQNMNQGTIETTNRPLDLALQGDGYLIYNLNGRQIYSRAGAITQDKIGNLIDSGTGAFLQGYNTQVDANGAIIKDANGANSLNRTLTNLQISPNIMSLPWQTQNVVISGNLNSSDPAGTERQTSIDIYDNLGGVRTISLTFTKSANANEYNVSATIDGNAVTLANNTITFNNDGTLNNPNQLQFSATDLNTALGSQVFDETTPKDITVTLASAGSLISEQLTQFAGPNTATATQRDGYESGSLLGLTVDQQGKVWGSFTNGQSELLEIGRASCRERV